MEMKILMSAKDEIEVQLGSVTLVEILRVYLNKDAAVTFAAWKQEHPTKNPILRVTTKGKTATKAINDAVATITKDLDKILVDFGKLKESQ